MKLVPILGVCTLLIAIPAVAHQRTEGYKKHKASVEDYDEVDRIKRSVATLIRAILNTAKLKHSSVDYRVYDKVGGYKDALRDFRSLKPNRVEKFKHSIWGNVGDRTVVVTSHYGEGRPVLNIWKVEQNLGGPNKLVVDRIEYRPEK